MSEYARYDFSESLRVANIEPHTIARVVAAWGHSPEGYGSWEGGFILAMKDGTYQYLTGWCDTTGWGCQDWTDVEMFAEEPPRSVRENSLMEYQRERIAKDGVAWDEEPADLNKWLADGARDDDRL